MCPRTGWRLVLRRVDWLYFLPAHPRFAALFTGLARTFCANFLRLLKCGSLVNTLFQTSFWDRLNSANLKTAERIEYDSRSTWLLVLALQWLGFGRLAQTEVLSPQSNAWTALRLDVNALVLATNQAQARSLFLTTLLEYRRLRSFATRCIFPLSILLLCDFPRVSGNL